MLKKKINHFIDTFLNFDLLTLAAALSFYTVLSLAPLLLIIFFFLGLWGREAEQFFLQQTVVVIGKQPAQTINQIVEGLRQNPELAKTGGIIGFATLLFSASGAFAQLQFSMNKIWSVENEGATGVMDWIHRRLLSFGMILALIFISIASLVVSTLMEYILSLNKTTWAVLNQVAALFGFCFIFSVLIKYLPDTKVPWREALKGGVLTALLFTIGKSLISLYLTGSALNSAYGAAGSLIVFLTWFYYSSLIILVGALYTETEMYFRKQRA